ncbi:MAG TPA: hypothetical protein HPP66_01495 [Planctomycetes bacterium]|nr:hypothetical protein [Planctomycetota bacterium]
MQNQNLKHRILNFGLCLLVFALCGCAAVDYVKPEGPPSDNQLAQSYYRTRLNVKTSADVLAIIHIPRYELLSQSKSVVASSGQKKKGHKIWLKMVAFNENDPTAKRKYFFIVDEKPKSFWVQPKRRLRFDSKMALEAEVFDEPYANESARRIAILRQVLTNVRKDISEVEKQDKTVNVCGMLISQTLETILVKLDASSELASRLNSPKGLDFDHITLGAGIIWMNIVADIVNVRIRVNSFVRTLDDPFAIED